LPEPVQVQAEKQLALLLENSHHPSLRIKKIKGHPYIGKGELLKAIVSRSKSLERFIGCAGSEPMTS
jgi:hypothetical protein